ncbi:hypothetical protein FTW19_07365 [Terriglobus albidus]|uniref:DUF6036 domain-containing protein n=1 Tax=Terriglobus albidus TaxID=1592106 RepID=A0A5B9EBL2_9BACT|nr:DUF6036 family nucleotidyltransferase [Terriglobus albidus]QEE27831.1 hypothetical protein FTW19_07365 [Terriglobus albidus]
MSTKTHPPEPWHSFFHDLDDAADTVVRLDCIGGFVVTQMYGLERSTADIDVIEIAPRTASDRLMDLALQGRPLHKKHRIYLDRVAVASIPENYEDRLVEMFPGAYRYLRLMALDPYDIALSKLERNNQKDRDDVRFLAHSIPLDLSVLEERYKAELRWQLGRPDREDLTMRLWLEMLHE